MKCQHAGRGDQEGREELVLEICHPNVSLPLMGKRELSSQSGPFAIHATKHCLWSVVCVWLVAGCVAVCCVAVFDQIRPVIIRVELSFLTQSDCSVCLSFSIHSHIQT